MKKVIIEVLQDPDGGEYRYALFIDHEDDLTMVASGSDESLAGVFHTLQGVTERTI